MQKTDLLPTPVEPKVHPRMNAFCLSRIGLLLPLALLSGLASAGCRRASEADCERIVDRIVELQLREQGITDPETIAKRKDETKSKKRQELLGGCVGKRISDASLKCIDGAKTSAEIIDVCLK